MRASAARRLALAAVLASCGCKDVVKPSAAGDLVVSYFGAGAAPGAIMLTITGGAVESVSPIAGLPVQVSYNVVIPGTTRVLLTGTLQTGDLFKIRVADTTLIYVARADQVADNVTFALVDPVGHTFTVHR